MARSWRRPWSWVTPLDKATDVVERELTALVLVFTLLWMVSPQMHAPAFGQAPLGYLLIGGAWLVLAAVEVTGRVQARALAGHLLLVCASVSALMLAVQSADPSATAGSMAVLVAVLAGTLLPAEEAAPGIALLVLAVTVSAADGADELMLPAIVLIAGIGSLIVQVLAGHNARLVDAEQMVREVVESQREVARGVRQTLASEERVLHETALNTLTAIARGGLTPSKTDVVADRCREAAEVLRALVLNDSRGESLDADGYAFGSVSRQVDRLRTQGVVVYEDLDALSEVPAWVRDAFFSAVKEALANVERHAAARHVTITASFDEALSPGRLTLDVVDDGEGFDTSVAPTRFGLRSAMQASVEGVGGQLHVESGPGRGTRVSMTWAPRQPDAIDDHRVAVGRLALPEAGVGALFVTVTALVAWGNSTQYGLSWVSATLVAALCAVLVLSAPEAPLSWSMLAVLGLVAVTITSAAMLEPGSIDGWTLGAVAAMFLVAAALSPPWGWLLLAAAAVAGGMLMPGCLSPLLACTLMGAAFGRSLRRDSALMVRTHDRRRAAVVSRDVADQLVGQVRARYALLDGTDADLFLLDIARGELDVADPQVRARAAVEEQFIRTLMHVQPERGPLPQLAAHLARRARDRGAAFHVDLGPFDSAVVTVPADVASSLSQAVDCMDVDAGGRLMAQHAGGQLWLSLVVTADGSVRDRMVALPLPGQVADPDDPTDLTILFETVLEGSST